MTKLYHVETDRHMGRIASFKLFSHILGFANTTFITCELHDRLDFWLGQIDVE